MHIGCVSDNVVLFVMFPSSLWCFVNFHCFYAACPVLVRFMIFRRCLMLFHPFAFMCQNLGLRRSQPVSPLPGPVSPLPVLSPRFPGLSPRFPGLSPRFPGLPPRFPGLSPRFPGLPGLLLDSFATFGGTVPKLWKIGKSVLFDVDFTTPYENVRNR